MEYRKKESPVGGGYYLGRLAACARQNPLYVTQLVSGLLVSTVVIICVLTLVSQGGGRQGADPRDRASRQSSLLLSTLRPPPASSGRLALNDVLITVKTSRQFHTSRLALVLQTWFPHGRSSSWVLTDGDEKGSDDDAKVVEALGDRLVVTDCPSDHSRQALCCKMQKEIDIFLRSNKKWFCHFDDDQYVNVPALVRKLGEFDHEQDWYLGKPSLQHPLEIIDRDSNDPKKKISFWFATGGAGFCLSQSVGRRLREVAGDGKFSSIGDLMRLPDDVTMGYVLEHILKVPLTTVEQFHSHLEPLRFVKNLEDQISFSYSRYKGEMNTVDVTGFSESEDSTRLLSLHCQLFPQTRYCSKLRR